jgi:uncharacterized protein YhhL (DUF1145 family)
MKERITALFRGPRTRSIGVVYLLFFLAAVGGAAFTPGTPKDIQAHEALFRLGYALTLISTVFYVALVALFYPLFRPVSRSLSVMAVFFGLVGCALGAVQSLFQLSILVVLGGSTNYSSAFTVEQLHALGQMFLDLSTQAGNVGIVFFGVFQLLIGYLIFRSSFLPRVLGVLMALAGLGWLTFLSPPLASHLFTFLAGLGILAELPLMLWLLVIGVDVQRWNEQAGVASTPSRGTMQLQRETP